MGWKCTDSIQKKNNVLAATNSEAHFLVHATESRLDIHRPRHQKLEEKSCSVVWCLWQVRNLQVHNAQDVFTTPFEAENSTLNDTYESLEWHYRLHILWREKKYLSVWKTLFSQIEHQSCKAFWGRADQKCLKVHFIRKLRLCRSWM